MSKYDGVITSYELGGITLVVKFENENYKAVIIPSIEAGDNRGLRFLKNDKVWLELLISGTSLGVSNNILTEDNVYDWLWMTGTGIADTNKKPRRIKLYHADVRDDLLVASIDNVESEDI